MAMNLISNGYNVIFVQLGYHVLLAHMISLIIIKEINPLSLPCRY